jgi:hypothetical protein
MEEVCGICGEPLDKTDAVSCIGCGAKIHFDSAENAEDSCSSIVIQGNTCALAFMCKRCSDMQPSESNSC